MGDEIDYNASDDQVDEFMIQNFRSWKGKNYLKINSLNFLFGENSSGKSSFINAIGLLLQSNQDGSWFSFPAKLIGNGSSVNLGKIENQFYGGIKNIMSNDKVAEAKLKGTITKTLLRPEMTKRENEDCFGFGYKCGVQTVNNLLKVGSMFGRVRDHNLWGLGRSLKDLEVAGYYDPRTGGLKSIELVVDNKLLLKLEKVRHKVFLIELGTDKNLWKNFHVHFFNTRLKDLISMVKGKSYPDDLSQGFIMLFQKNISKINEIARDYKVNIFEVNQIRDLISKKKREDGPDESGPGDWASIDEFVYASRKKFSDKTGDVSIDASLKGGGEAGGRYEITLESLERDLADILNWFDEHGLKVTENEEEAYENILRVWLPFYDEVLSWEKFENFHNFIKCNAKTIVNTADKGFLGISQGMKSHNLREFSQVFLRLKFGLYRFNMEEINDKNFKSEKPLNSAYDFMALSSLLDAFIFPDGFGVESCLENISRHLLAGFLGSCTQIGPYRERPERVPVIDTYKDVEEIGISGQNLLNFLHKNYRHPTAIVEVNNWLKKMEIGYSIKTKFNRKHTIQELELYDESGIPVSLLDVGYGVSQVLPIILQTLLAKNQVITIEQPELHIHPKLQANLADLFIWSAKNNNNKFIIETHSEHIILRLQKRQRDNDEDSKQPNEKIKPDNVNWVNIFTSVNINVIRKRGIPPQSDTSELKITSKGEFNGDWPGGFFIERYKEKGII